VDGEDVTVYYMTGGQLRPLSVPHKCEECDLTIRTVQTALWRVDRDGTLSRTTKPWLRHMFSALSGGWHPPVVMIEGEVLSQGVGRSVEALGDRLRELLQTRRRVEAMSS